MDFHHRGRRHRCPCGLGAPGHRAARGAGRQHHWWSSQRQLWHIAELALAFFVLSQAQTQVVQAQITGSIIGTTLLCVGSAIQIALVVAPVLVLTSWIIGHPMNLVFGSPLDLFAIATTAFIVRAIAADGETTWFERLLLVGVYVLFAIAYYFESPT
jgi:Ca2+/H+ antiporter